jgi:hypothetical protein
LNHPFRSDRRSFLKGKTVRKVPPKQKLRANIIKMLDDMKESENGVSKVTVKITTRLIKFAFEISLMQKY